MTWWPRGALGCPAAGSLQAGGASVRPQGAAARVCASPGERGDSERPESLGHVGESPDRALPGERKLKFHVSLSIQRKKEGWIL